VTYADLAAWQNNNNMLPKQFSNRATPWTSFRVAVDLPPK
jgi:hypothetical protein